MIPFATSQQKKVPRDKKTSLPDKKHPEIKKPVPPSKSQFSKFKFLYDKTLIPSATTSQQKSTPR